MSDQTPVSSARSLVSLFQSTRFDCTSAINGRTYRIFVFKPPVAPPASGYPVVTVLDANLMFPIAATMGATFVLEGRPALVVGIGYPTDDRSEHLKLRRRDLTPPVPTSGIRRGLGQPAPAQEETGGSHEFYRFIVEELRPLIASTYEVNADDQALYGHSLGGLFALGALFEHPNSFRNFIASSPSIFWNDCALLNHESGFVDNIKRKGSAPRVLITVGAKEQDVPETPLPNMTPAQMEQAVRGWRMVDNARELAARLQRAKGGPDYLVRFHAFDEEDHLTVFPASISRALAFSLRSAPPARRQSR